MAPLSASNPGGDASASLKDWKELIDNGLINGGGSAHSVRQNRTAATEDLSSSRAPGSVGNHLIPLYCGLLGALICGLVLWVVLKHARGRDSKLQPPPPAASAEHAAASAPLAPGRRTAAPGGEGGANEDVAGRRRLVDLSESRMRRLEQMLDRGSGWKVLAAEMGYESSAVAEFESRGAGSASASGLLLRDWAAAAAAAAASTDSDAGADTAATVGDLRRRLLAAGLADALPCLRGDSATASAVVERKRRHRPAAAAAAPAAPDAAANANDRHTLELASV